MKEATDMTIQELLKRLDQKLQKLDNDLEKAFVLEKSQSEAFRKKRSEIYNRYRLSGEQLRKEQTDFENAWQTLSAYAMAQPANRETASRPDAARKAKVMETANRIRSGYYGNMVAERHAGEVITDAAACLAEARKQVTEHERLEKEELRRIDREEDSAAEALESSRQQLVTGFQTYLQSEEGQELRRKLDFCQKRYSLENQALEAWQPAARTGGQILIGYRDYKIRVPSIALAALQTSLGGHFRTDARNVTASAQNVFRTLESGVIRCPVGIHTNMASELLIQYQYTNEAEAKQGVQALLLNALRCFPLNEMKVSVLDFIHYNADVLGPLAVFCTIKKGVFDELPIGEEAQRKYLQLLVDSCHQTEQKLGSQTVFAYNQDPSHSIKIPQRILIINQTSQSGAGNRSELAYLLNNAQKLGLIIIRMVSITDDGGKTSEQKQIPLLPGVERILISGEGYKGFEILVGGARHAFQWNKMSAALPQGFTKKVSAAMKPAEMGTKFFQRHTVRVPKKSVGKRKPIEVPFAVDDDDNEIVCSFENDRFAAYVMGAAGSGKSTLLHTIIAGLLMNYHPDELELWLMDFKMLEFKRYVNCRPPHIRYLLLEKSEDLVFAIIDRLTNVLNQRERLFAKRGWDKLSNVPPEENIPAIFVIMDEFAQMSQILKETQGNGLAGDYTLKLENLLARGRALGIKFIFASQTFTDGVAGLTETARKQIQTRFALKNTSAEIRETLGLTSDLITPEVSMDIATLPPYKTIFKWQDEDGAVHVKRLHNMYTEPGENENLINVINKAMHAVSAGSSTDDTCYIEKNPILVDGGQPQSFRSLAKLYRQYEEKLNPEEFDEGDVFLYAGVPCSFDAFRPIRLAEENAENILLAGGGRDEKVNVLYSILHSYAGKAGRELPVEIWANRRAGNYRAYKDGWLAKFPQVTDLQELCRRIRHMNDEIRSGHAEPRMIVVLGYERIAEDLEILGEEEKQRAKEDKQRAKEEKRSTTVTEPTVEASENQLDLAALVGIGEAKPDISSEQIEAYNQTIQKENDEQTERGQQAEEENTVYDAREDVKLLLKRGARFGVHFLFCFEHGQDFLRLKLDEKLFRHKLLFPMPVDDARSIAGNKKAAKLESGSFVYTNGLDCFTMRPHIHYGVPWNGWKLDRDDSVVQTDV